VARDGIRRRVRGVRDARASTSTQSSMCASDVRRIDAVVAVVVV
jgi:hypothetical protein